MRILPALMLLASLLGHSSAPAVDTKKDPLPDKAFLDSTLAPPAPPSIDEPLPTESRSRPVTSLLMAVRTNQPREVRRLLDAGADPDLADSAGLPRCTWRPLSATSR